MSIKSFLTHCSISCFFVNIITFPLQVFTSCVFPNGHYVMFFGIHGRGAKPPFASQGIILHMFLLTHIAMCFSYVYTLKRNGLLVGMKSICVTLYSTTNSSASWHYILLCKLCSAHLILAWTASRCKYIKPLVLLCLAPKGTMSI